MTHWQRFTDGQQNVVVVLPFIVAGGAQVKIFTVRAFIAHSNDLSLAAVTVDANVQVGGQSIEGVIRSWRFRCGAYGVRRLWLTQK